MRWFRLVGGLAHSRDFVAARSSEDLETITSLTLHPSKVEFAG